MFFFSPPFSISVCGSIDIRNNVSNFELLRNCEVIEGNLQIVLVTNSYCDKCNEIINNITFPELREVTGFVVLWRVQGLRTLSTLFPNLSVIRGRTLFENYALVAYEMKSLQVTVILDPRDSPADLSLIFFSFLPRK